MLLNFGDANIHNIDRTPTHLWDLKLVHATPLEEALELALSIGNEVFCLGLSYTIVESSYKNAKEIALRLEPSPDLVLIGSELKVPYDSVPVLDKDTFYHEDLIGLKVFEFERFLGIITDIIETGSNDVYVVTNSDNEILIPGIKSVIKAVDIADQKMLVVLPKGL